MSIFVFYDDGYAEDGDKDLVEFSTKTEAAKFIEERLSCSTRPDLSNYRVIAGTELVKNVVSVITAIEIGGEA
jgi:hypothetical protein